MTLRPNAAQAGFTLVELSVVLVIIALITGGLLAGVSLLHATEHQKIVTRVQEYQAAMLAFKQRYGELPGDMHDAVDYWGAKDANVVNGNGDGTIASGGVTTVGATRESLQYWTHLGNAGLIGGKYEGKIVTNWWKGKVNVPELIDDVVADVKTQPAYWTNMTAGSYYVIGGLSSSGGHTFLTNNPPSTKSLFPEEIYNLDVKFDDGDEKAGKLVILNIGSNCSFRSGGVFNDTRCLFGWRMETGL